MALMAVKDCGPAVLGTTILSLATCGDIPCSHSSNSSSEASLKGRLHSEIEVVLDLALTQLAEGAPATIAARSDIELARLGDRQQTDLDRLGRHLTLERLFERQECRVNGIFQREVVVVPVGRMSPNQYAS